MAKKSVVGDFLAGPTQRDFDAISCPSPEKRAENVRDEGDSPILFSALYVGSTKVDKTGNWGCSKVGNGGREGGEGDEFLFSQPY